jgi:hypothetical protein
MHLRRRHLLPPLSRFGWLMGLYSENFSRLKRLLPLQQLQAGVYRSVGHDSLVLRAEVIERHRYTLELRMTYEMSDPEIGESDPSAWVRIYFDAHQVEVTHCHAGRRWQDVIGMFPAAEVLMGHRLRMNGFLSKWLDYLDVQGHGLHSWQRAEDGAEPQA